MDFTLITHKERFVQIGGSIEKFSTLFFSSSFDAPCSVTQKNCGDDVCRLPTPSLRITSRANLDNTTI